MVFSLTYCKKTTVVNYVAIETFDFAGQKFRFGKTFGAGTENPLNLKKTTPTPIAATS